MLKISSNKLSRYFELPTLKDWRCRLKSDLWAFFWMIQKKKTDLHTTDQSLHEPSAFPRLLAFMDKVSRHTRLMEVWFWHCKSSHDVNVMVIPIWGSPKPESWQSSHVILFKVKEKPWITKGCALKGHEIDPYSPKWWDSSPTLHPPPTNKHSEATKVNGEIWLLCHKNKIEL